MKNYYFFTIILLFSLFTFSQNNQKIDSVYTNYFQNTREIPYLHLNKTSFVKSEEIWFKAYVLEHNSRKLHPTTSNLYVSIFNESGKMKDQHLIHIKNGMGKGNILIDSTYTNKIYFIKASTNWMKNFNEDNSYNQKITIISDKKKETIKNKEKKNYDFELFPEGGHLLVENTNNIGILIKDTNNKGLKTSNGKIKNLKNETIGEFSTNNFGLGKVSLSFDKNESYYFEVKLPNGTIKKETPKLKKLGVTLKIEKLNSSLRINILTNKNSLKKLNNKKYTVFIHNTKKFEKIYFKFNNRDLKYTLDLNYRKLSSGINIITIFNEKNKPILERMIFNEPENLYSEINYTKEKINNNSIRIKINNPTNNKLYLSTSFLPSKTKSYKPLNNIFSKFLLEPYVEGNIEDPQYYFNKKNKNRLTDLDLLLLTQGWSKYNWSTIFDDNSEYNYTFSQGIDLKINFNKSIKKGESVLIYSPTNNILREISPEQNPFLLKNSFIKKGSKIDFSLKKKNRLLKITPVLSYSKGKIIDFINLKKLIKFSTSFKKNEDDEVDSSFLSLLKEDELLDEVIVDGKKRYDNNTTGIANSFKKMNFKNLPFNKGSLIQFIIPIYDQYKYSLHHLGAIYLNGEIISGTNSLNGISMNQVREVRMGTSSFGTTREMHIYTYSLSEQEKLREKSVGIKLPIGFQKNKEYYQPKYSSYNNKNYTDFGAIYWKPNIIIKPFTKIEFNIPLNNQKIINAYFEGIYETGKLISNKKTIVID